jgi:DNA-binding NarL/FixJ family response regulator
MMRLGLAHFLNLESDISVCGEAPDAMAALAGVEQTQPDLVVLDISLEGRSGLDLLQDLRLHFPRIPVLVHSMYDEMIYAERALVAGARGFLMKQETGEKLLVAVRQVLSGQIYLSDRLQASSPGRSAKTSPPQPQTPISRLSKREFEVFRLIGQGCANQHIAKLLSLSIKTVDAHREHIKSKLNVTTSTALNLLAVRWESEQNR